MISNNIDNLSWIAGFKSKKEEVSRDYESIRKHLLNLNLKESGEWNIEITTHKIKAKAPVEGALMMNQTDTRNVIMKTLSNNFIVYSDILANQAYIFYLGADEDRKSVV